jgi:hypothetical protein
MYPTFCDLKEGDFIPESEKLPVYPTYTAVFRDLTYTVYLDISCCHGGL